MKVRLLFFAFASCFVATSLYAGTPEQEKAFVEKYKKAFEAGDKATLQSFLYTQGANPMVLEFYKKMQGDGVGQKISKIELLDLSPQDVKKADAVMDAPGGQKVRLPLKPSKKLKITIETKTADTTSTSSTESFIAEKDGNYVIPVPASMK